MTYDAFWSYYGAELIDQWGQHVAIVAAAAALGTIIALSLCAVVYRNARWSEWLLRVTGIALTVPSMALYVILLSAVGIGWPPTLVALTLFSLRPIVQNALVGLQGVDRSVVEAARGVGMSRIRCLIKVEMPLAWPFVATGIRIATTLLVTTATISAIVLGPGLGNSIYRGLKSLGTPNALYFAGTGIVGVILVGLTFTLTLVIIERLTTSRGIRG